MTTPDTTGAVAEAIANKTWWHIDEDGFDVSNGMYRFDEAD